MSMETTLKGHMAEATAIYAKATGRTPSTVGNLAFNDGGFFKRLDEGAAFKTRTYDALMTWLATNWPPDVDWPAGVPRPAKDFALLLPHASGPTPQLKKRMTSKGAFYKAAS